MDASIIVECVYDKGDICHIHINPAYLEKYEPWKDDDDFELLMTASNLLRGRGNLDFFCIIMIHTKKSVSSKVSRDGKGRKIIGLK